MFSPSLRRYQQALASASTRRPLYYIQRNSNGNLPVYTDIRNAGSRFLVQIRNVEGSPEALALELRSSLFAPGSYEAHKAKIRTNHGHVVVSGGRWKVQVVEWLKAKGF